VTADTRM